MSVISAPLRASRLWPLWLLAGLFIGGALLVWLYWSQILLQSVLLQKDLHRQMTQLLQQVADQPNKAGLSLVIFSLLYGVLHALGPGHGKVVIATFLATHPSRVRTSIRLTLLASLLQGSIAILLVTVMLVLLKTSSRQLHLSSFLLEKGSYLLVIGLGVMIGYRALRSLWRALRPRPAPQFRAFRPNHQHDEHCGCGHAHLPTPQQMSGNISWKTQMLVVVSMGLRPCSGAIMMLLFAKVIGVYGWGILSAAVMAVGTALTISAIGLLVQQARSVAQRLAQPGAAPGITRLLMPTLALTGSLILIVAGIALWQSAQLTPGGGIRPF
ncbi:nickel/cobalt transporter [Pantoea sp. Bo_2]|uniref:Nickel/cobalt efflux system n=1 Tax=Candidatus Pantoea gossypiicola TaxID=2608008 RepID=A0AB34CGY2_9GAMM|nr:MULTISPECIES: nickel/cobalt transporter [Pantoea]KAA5921415.1 nickel/cobalt transporter [Pantoea sp. VH_8]KAA5927864.1 nickel/cobalt transporter [Pantoea sp. VH_4]KAA5946653.1 nickel/cobalt transporter [Pantoea sp. VH_3]KAA5956892.1 nickel/cobalt transporter [Pantoea sp. VH_25]KAA5961170.1 nickel/cobalt transporter [Pantoea sp. VH_24]